MTDVTYGRAPLARFALSPLNARFGRDVPTEDLEAAIPARGDLVSPLSCYPGEGDQLLVWDGGRRLLALQKLGKKLPAALAKAGVPYLLHPSAEAAQVDSLATFIREGMSPADEFAAARRLIDAGLSLTETAAAVGLRTPRVQQLLRLVALAPDVLEAFQGGKIPLDVAEAFTLTEDHERQREVFKAFNPKKDNAWGVRQSFRKAAVAGDDRWALFVGREAYAAAGGRFLTDLFSDKAQEDWLDRKLLTRLADTKVQALKAKIEAEGWQWVEIYSDSYRHYEWDKKLDRLPGKKDTFTLEERASAGVSLMINRMGQPDIIRGLVPKKAGVKRAANGDDLPKTDQALYGFGHGGHEYLTSVATAAVQVAVALEPEAAYDAVLSSLAWTAFRESGRNGDSGTSESNAASLRTDERGYGFQKLVAVAGMPELLALAKGWLARLPVDRLAFCDYVAGLTPAEKASLLAVSYAWSLNAVEHRSDYMRRPTRWAHLGWIGRHAGVDINAAWTPDAEFLKKGTREALLIGITDAGGAEGMQSAKKGELVTYMANLASSKRWVPKLLADLFAAPAKPKAEPKAKAEKPAKGKPADEFGDQLKRAIAETKAEEAAETHADIVAALAVAAGGEAGEA